MSVWQTLTQPAVITRIIGKLSLSLLTMLAVMLPGLLLCIAGYAVVGTLCLFAGSFFMMARRYRKPWRWNPWLAIIPVVAAICSALIQLLIFSDGAISVLACLVAGGIGLLFGWQRGRSHRLYLEQDRIMVSRTIFYLAIWAACTGLTQLAGLTSIKALITPALMSSIFSAAMMLAMTAVLFAGAGKARQHLASGNSASLVQATLAGFAILIVPQVAVGYQSPDAAMVTRMVDVTKPSINAAAAKSGGLLEQSSQAYALPRGQGTSLQTRAAFDVDVGTYVMDVDSEVVFNRHDTTAQAEKQRDALMQTFRPLVSGQIQTGSRGKFSAHADYDARTGGVGHRSIIQHGQWVIDVDTRSWDASTDDGQRKLMSGLTDITMELSNSIYDNGISTGLIDQNPVSPPTLQSAPATPTPNATAPINRTNRPPPTPSIVTLPEPPGTTADGPTPEEIAQATALIAILLVLGGLSVDVANTFAQEIADGMFGETPQQDDPDLIDDDEVDAIENELDTVDAELADEPDSDELDDDSLKPEIAPPMTNWDIAKETAKGSRNDLVTAIGELADLVPVLAETVDETARDVQSMTPGGFDLTRIAGVKDDLLAAGNGLYELIQNLGRLAGNTYATEFDQDPNVMTAIELLAIIARRAAIPGSSAIDGSDAALQELLTNRRSEVIAGLERIAEMSGKVGVEAGRMAIGAQEWENSVNGDLSPLTRIVNSLMASGQLYGLLEGAASKLASKADEVADLASGANAAGKLDDGVVLAEEVANHPPRAGSQFEMHTRGERGVLGRDANRPRQPFANRERYGIPDVGTTPTTYIHGLPEGAIIDMNKQHHTGYTGPQIDALRKLARNEEIVTGTRLTNMDSMRHIRDGTGVAKPLPVKSKTIGDLDIYFGASPKDKGLVGLFDPGPVRPTHANNSVPKDVWNKLDDAGKNDLIHKLGERWDIRTGEFGKRHKLVGSETASWDSTRGVVVDKKTGKPFAGDIDPVFFRDAKTGKYLSADRYLEVVNRFKNSGVKGQHGAEINILGDLTAGHKPGTQAWHDAYENALAIQNDLGKTHTSGKEVVVEMGPDGILRRGTYMGGGLPDAEGARQTAARFPRP